MIKRFLNYKPFSLDLGLFILRVLSAAFLLTHGWPKVSAFTQRMNSFPDPFGVGSVTSFSLVVFAEFFCSILVIIGLWTRFAVVPIIITMITIVFVIHGADPFGKKEVALLYLASFTTIFFTGPGKYSIDGFRG